MAVSVYLPSTMTPMGRGVSPPTPIVKFGPVVDDYIDPATNDFASLTRRLDTIDAQVLVALKTDKASGAAVENDGNNLRGIKKINPNVAGEVESEIRNALARLVRNRDIRIDAISIEVLPQYQQVEVFVEYFNLRTRPEDRTAIRLVITT